MSEVERYYDTNAETEWRRLEMRPTEFALTRRALHEFLPPSPAAVLDIGGGPGRYAIALAQQGYAVTLADLSRGLLDAARMRASDAGVAMTDYVHCNALGLSRFDPGSFDAVLLMGPLYHLLALEERQRAVREAARVLRAGGVIIAAFINRYTWVLWADRHAPALLARRRAWAEATVETGALRFPDGGDWVDAYWAHPSEIRPLMESGGFETIATIACDGVLNALDERAEELTDEAKETLVDFAYRLGKDPATHGAGGHLLYVGRRWWAARNRLGIRGDEPAAERRGEDGGVTV